MKEIDAVQVYCPIRRGDCLAGKCMFWDQLTGFVEDDEGFCSLNQACADIGEIVVSLNSIEETLSR